MLARPARTLTPIQAGAPGQNRVIVKMDFANSASLRRRTIGNSRSAASRKGRRDKRRDQGQGKFAQCRVDAQDLQVAGFNPHCGGTATHRLIHSAQRQALQRAWR